MANVTQLQFKISSAYDGAAVDRARESIAALNRDLDTLSNKSVRVSVEVDSSALTRLRTDLDNFSRISVTAQANVNTQTAALEAARVNLERFGGMRVVAQADINARTAALDAARADLDRFGIIHSTAHADIATQTATLIAARGELERFGAIRETAHADVDTREAGAHLHELTGDLDGANGGFLRFRTGAAGAGAGMLAFSKIALISIGIIDLIGPAAALAGTLLLTGLGGAFIAVGTLILFKSKQMGESMKQLKTQLVQDMSQAADAMRGPLLAGIAQLQAGLHQLTPAFAQAFGAAGQLIKPLVQSFLNFTNAVMPGVIVALRAAAPVFDGLAQGMGLLGAGVGDMFRQLAAGAQGFKQTWIVLGTQVGAILGTLGHAFAQMASVGAQSLNNILIGLNGLLGGLFAAVMPLIAPLGLLTRAIGVDLGNALRLAGPGIGQLISALVSALIPALNILLPVLGLVIGELASAFVPVIIALKPLLLLFAIGLASILNWLRPILPVLVPLVAGLWLLNAALLANPAILIAAGIVILVGALVFLATHWTQTWNIVKNVAATVWNFLTHGWGQLILLFIGPVGWGVLLIAHWTQVWNAVKAVAVIIWNALAVAWRAFVAGLAVAWNATSAALRVAWNAVWNAIKIAGMAIWTAMTVAWRAFVTGLTVAWNATSAALRVAWNAVWNAMKVVASAIWTGLTIAWRAFVTGLTIAWNATSAALRVAWNAVWTVMGVVARAIWAAMAAAWNAFIVGMRVIWTATSAALVASWNAVWNVMKLVANAIWTALQVAWQAMLNVMHAAWTGFTAIIGAAWSGFWNLLRATGIAIWTFIQTAWQVMLNVMHDAWSGFTAIIGAAWAAFWNAIKAVGIAIWSFIQIAWQTALNVMHDAWSGFTAIIGAAWNGFWNAIKAAGIALWAAIQAAWQTALNVMHDAWSGFTAIIGAAWNGFWNAIRAAGIALWKTIQDAWQVMLNVMHAAWSGFTGILGAAWNGFWNALRGFFNGFASAILAATHALFNAMVAAWRAGANAIGAAWSVIKKLVRDPIAAVVNVVYNHGIVPLWNTVAGVFGAPKLSNFNLPGFATGGPVTGPGTATSDSVVARLSSGEHVWTAKEVAAAGGHQAVLAMRSGAIGGGYRAEKQGDGIGGFALGGIIPSPGDILGDIAGFFSKAFKVVGGVASAAFNGATGFAGDIIAHLAKLALGTIAPIINPLIQKAANVGKDAVKAIIPGSPGIEQLIAGGGAAGSNGASAQGALNTAGNKGMIQTMVDYIKDFITSHDIPIGGGNTAEAQKWADAQVGKPYGLGTFGSSFDCSSFMSGIAQIILGKKPSPLFTTFAFTGAAKGPATFERNLNAPFMVGVENRGIGHMAGTLNGKNYEATPPRVRSGPGALGAHSSFFDMVYGMKASMGFGGGIIPSGQHLAVIDAALAAAGVPPPGSKSEWEAGMNTLITRESGWNAGAINRTDSNAAAGHPSQGLAQVIPSTFAAFHAPGTSNNILDPVANVAAAIRYIVSRYGNITNVQQANASKPPQGYWSGTDSATTGWHEVGEHGPEWVKFHGGEKVLPHGKRPDDDSRPVHVHVENHWHGNPTVEAVQHAENGMAEKLRQACVAGVGGRAH